MYFKVKRLLICILCLYSSFLCAQEQDKTLIFGKILTSDKNFAPRSYRGLSYIITYPNSNQNVTLGYCEVDSLGLYSEFFPHGVEVSLFPSYPDFYGDTIAFNTEKKEKIEENFYIRRRTYPYTEEKAKEDIKNGIVNLIIFDSTLYELNRRYNYTQNFGFNYKLLKGGDNDFDFQIIYYNRVISEYIDSLLNKDTWHQKVNVIEDSLSTL